MAKSEYLSETCFRKICERLSLSKNIPLEKVLRHGRTLLATEGVYVVPDAEIGNFEQAEYEMQETIRRRKIEDANIIGGLTDILQILEGNNTGH